MAGGKLFTAKAWDLLLRLRREHPKWVAKQFQSIINEQLRENWGLSVYQKKLAEASNVVGQIRRETKALDHLWTVGDLVHRPIPPDSLSFVMARLGRVFFDRKEKSGAPYYVEDHLTIREALWIARLCRLFPLDQPKQLEALWDWAWLYAREEWMWDYRPGKLDMDAFQTLALDTTFVLDPGYATRERAAARLISQKWLIASKYNADPQALIALNLPLPETEEAAKSGKYPDTRGLFDKKEGQNK